MPDDGPESPELSPPCDEPTPAPSEVQSAAPDARETETPASEWFSRRMAGYYALGLVLLAILAVDVVYIGRAVSARSAAAGVAAAAAVAPADHPAREQASGQGQPCDGDDTGDDGDAGELPTPQPDDPRPSKPKKAATAQTVEQAFSRGCSTGSVDGLSRQIVSEARCIDANAFAVVPSRKNLVTPGNVFLYLEAPARDQLVKVLDAHPDRKMTVNSALRTVAQQYLLDRWARTGRCGIKLAARPGESNHETGLALDVSEHGTWRAALEERGFHWLGPSDKVHFDFQGPGASRREGLDIVAFQRLWNRNHPEDRIPENGAYSEQVEARVKKSPASGFAQGPTCRSASGSPHRAQSADRRAHP